MTPQQKNAIARRAEKAASTPRPPKGQASTPNDAMLQAVLTGQFETLVAKARPAEPPKMVTPEEREAELRAAGKWQEDAPKAEAPPAGSEREPEPAPGPEPGMPTEPTPGELWANERCSWRPRLSSSLNRNPRPGRCITEYDVLTGEIIGDGYDPRY